MSLPDRTGRTGLSSKLGQPSQSGLPGFGQTAPNPCVGALLVRGDWPGFGGMGASGGIDYLDNPDWPGNLVLAAGFHAAAGQDHAEVAALKDAAAKNVNPAECTLVVTLEPCNHYGKTPPCTKAILEAGIKRVVIGATDPNPQAAGGAAFLRAHGVQVECGVAAQECLDNIADFLVWQNTARPYVLLKLAATLDGRIATRNGHSQWISGPQALARVHELRAGAQAVLIGGNTFYQDNPRLTCRLSEAEENGQIINKIPAPHSTRTIFEPQPLAVVVTSHLPEPDRNFNLLRERPEQVIFLTSTALADSHKAEALRCLGARVWGLDYASLPASPDQPGKPDKESTPRGSDKPDELSKPGQPVTGLDLAAGLERLRREYGVYYLLCEGGGRLGLNLLEHQLVDEFRLHLSPKIIGDNQARPLFDGRSQACIEAAPGLRFTGAELCGEDLLLQLRKTPQILGGVTKQIILLQEQGS